MSVRHLDSLLRPSSVALVGASTRERSVGALIAHNLLAAGFEGPIMPVNPKHAAVAGVLAYPDVASLPKSPDLAVICTPPATVPGLLAELGARGTKAAIVVTAGFSELGNDTGRRLQQAMLDAARPHLLRVVGPNCIGVISTPARLNASFAHVGARPGGVAFVAQSGAMLTSILDWATARGIGFSHLVSLGDMVDVDFGDMLDYLASDTQTSAVLLYIEAITHARKFMSAARACARAKPVIAIKAGRHPAAAKAALSHTGALAGSDAVYDAAFRRAGVLRVLELDELFDAVETVGKARTPAGDRLAILTNGGGAGVLATDALIDHEGTLAALSPELIAKLDGHLPATWSRGNPVDIIGDAPPERYAVALESLLESSDLDAVLVLNCPTAIASGEDAARAVVETSKKAAKPILTSWLGAAAAEPARRIFSANGVPTYETPDQAIEGFMHLVGYRRAQDLLMQVPPSIPNEFVADPARARALVAGKMAAGGGWLDDEPLRELLACYGIPTPRTAHAATPEEAGRKAQELGVPVALKIVSPDITHKSDVGGVALDLTGEKAVREAAEQMFARVAQTAPRARLTGFLLQEMISRPHAHELILGMTVDQTFGPVLLFGHGGTAVEVIADKTLALPPLNLALARAMMERTRIFRELQGYRDRPRAALDAIALTLVKLAQLVCDLDDILEIDINPLLADENGVIALDTRMRVDAPGKPKEGRLAISPYPRELERDEDVPGLGRLRLRPVRPEDAPAFQALFERLAPEDVRLRFFSAWQSLPPRQLARLTQIDYDRELAFVLEQPASGEIIGVVRLAADPDNAQAEFAVTVRSDLKHHGLGHLLMERLIAYARGRGIGMLFGLVLPENAAMLTLSHDLGFARSLEPGGQGIVRVELRLAG